MYLLTAGLKKLVCLALAIVLCMVWGSAIAQDGGSENLGVSRKRNVDRSSRQKVDSEDASQDGRKGGEDSTPEDEEGESETLPDIRRRPPRTDEEEQRYKLFKFQTDPFLTVWDFSSQQKAYNPMDFLTGSVERGFAQYIAQSPSGEVVGSLSINVDSAFGNEHGQMVQITLHHRLDRWLDTTILVEPETFRPIRFEQWDLGLGGNSGGNGVGAGGAIARLSLPRFLAKYSFDRVDIEHEQGDMISRARFRQLPYSFDKASFVLVARHINFRFPNWPFQAPLTDPMDGAKIILSIPKPTRVEVLSAEPKTYSCYELNLQLGVLEEIWWIERVPPHRLVKFTENGITYTLSQYLEHK